MRWCTVPFMVGLKGNVTLVEANSEAGVKFKENHAEKTVM